MRAAQAGREEWPNQEWRQARAAQIGREDWRHHPNPTHCHICKPADSYYASASLAEDFHEIPRDAPSLNPLVATRLTEEEMQRIIDVALQAGFEDIAGLLDLKLQLGAPRREQFPSNDNPREGTNPCPFRIYVEDPTGRTFKSHAAANGTAFSRYMNISRWSENSRQLLENDFSEHRHRRLMKSIYHEGPPICVFCSGGKSTHTINSRHPAGRTRCLQENCECNNNVSGTTPSEMRIMIPLHGWDKLVKILKNADTHHPALQKVMALRDVMEQQQLMVVDWQVAQEEAQSTFPSWLGKPSKYYAIWHFLSTKGIGDGLQFVWKLMRHHDDTRRRAQPHRVNYIQRPLPPSEWWQGCVTNDVAHGILFHREQAQRFDDRAFGPNLPEENEILPLRLMAGQALLGYFPDLYPILDKLHRRRAP